MRFPVKGLIAGGLLQLRKVDVFFELDFGHFSTHPKRCDLEEHPDDCPAIYRLAKLHAHGRCGADRGIGLFANRLEPFWQRERINHGQRSGTQHHPREPLFGLPGDDFLASDGRWIHELSRR